MTRPSLVAAGVAAFNWDDIVLKFKGKKVIVLGGFQVGKTSLVKFLSTGSIPEEYKSTALSEKETGRRFQLKDLDLNIKDMVDVSSNKAYYREWMELFNESDVVFYLFRVDHLLQKNKQTEERIRNDIVHIEGWINYRKPEYFFIIGTHCDLDPEWKNLPSDKLASYYEKIQTIPIVREMNIKTQGSKVILGSLKSKDSIERLVYDIFKKVNS